MKKTKFKNYLKLGIFLFGVSIFLINCERDYIEESELENVQKLTVKIVDFPEIETNRKAFSKIERIFNSKNEFAKNSRDTIINNEYGFSIDTDYVKYVENGNYNSYNFEITRDNPIDDNLENLFLTLNEDEEYDAFIVKYNFTREELNSLAQEELENRTTQYTAIDVDSSFLNERSAFRDELSCETEWILVFSPRDFEGDWVSEIVCTGGGGPGPGPNQDETGTGDITTGGNQGSGSPGGSNTGTDTSGSPPYSAPTCADCPEVIDYISECSKIDSLFINNPTLKQELIALKGNTGASTERGKYKLNSTTLIQSMPVGVNAEVSMPIPTGTQKYEMIAHTHNHPASATYSVFSFDDLLGMNQLLKLGKIDTSKFTAFLMTEDGTNYAFTINNPTQFLKVFATKFDVGFDQSTSLNTYVMKEKYYDGITSTPSSPAVKPLIVENSSNNLKNEKLFLDFLKDVNMGLSLFEVNDTFDSYEMVTHNTRTDSIVKQNCN